MSERKYDDIDNSIRTPEGVSKAEEVAKWMLVTALKLKDPEVIEALKQAIKECD